jgi:hypothetical protein
MRTNKKQTGEEKMKQISPTVKYIRSLDLSNYVDRREVSYIINAMFIDRLEKFSDEDLTLDESLVEMTKFLLDILETKKEGVA